MRKFSLAGILTVIMAFCLSSAVVSCSKRAEDEPSVEEEGEYGVLSINVADPSVIATKASGSGISYDTHEAAVNRWAIFIFTEDGSSYVYRKSGLGKNDTIERRLRVGTYQVRAIANYAQSGTYAFDINSVKNLTQFNALVSGLEDNALGSFVMYGTTTTGTVNVVKTSGDESIAAQIYLRRMVSKVTLANVTLDFAKASLRSKDVTLSNVYLTNVYPKNRYSSDYSSSELESAQNKWFNCMGWHKAGSITLSTAATAAVDAITADRNLNQALTKNVSPSSATPTAVNRVYYFYPNPTLISADSHSSTWTGARCTRLILEVVIDSKTYYYQCNLPKVDANAPIRRNTAMTVSCRITALGSLDPEQEIPPAIEWTFSIDDNDWTDATPTPVSEES